MKAIIDYPLSINLEQSLEDIDFSQLDSFSVKYSIKNNILIIEPQKISLSEINMNSLFSNWFQYDCIISYGFLGGEGCDFSIDIIQKKDQK